VSHYDAAGRVSGRQWTDSGGVTSSHSFGWNASTGRLDSETVDGRSWAYDYSAIGDLLSVTNPDGRRIGQSFDVLGRRSSVTGADGLIRTFAYDEADNVASVAADQILADTFTAADGSEPDPAKWDVRRRKGGSVAIVDNSALLDVTDRGASEATLKYEGAARDSWDVSFTVDPSTLTGDSRLRAFARFKNDNHWDMVQFKAGESEARVVRRSKGKNRRIGTLAVPDGPVRVRVLSEPNRVSAKVWPVGDLEPSGWQVTRTDDRKFRAGVPRWEFKGRGTAASMSLDDVEVTDTAGPVPLAEYQWDRDGRLLGESLLGGARRDWTYDSGRLVEFASAGSSADETVGLSYDSSGRLASEVRGGDVRLLGYDDGGQLVSDTGGRTGDASYGYDPLGRPSVTSTGWGSSTFAYDAAGQLTSSVEAGTGVETTYGFDGAGRRTSEATDGATVGFSYDPAGRLVATNGPEGSTQRLLSPSGLVESVVSDTGVSSLDWAPGAELVSLTEAGEGISTLTRADPRVPWGAVTSGDSAVAAASDQYGSFLAAPDEPGIGIGGSFDAFGNPDANSPTFSGRTLGGDGVGLGYRGEVTIDGDVFLRARTYDPMTSQFLSTDPIAGQVGTTVGDSPYHYANNNPISYSDPSGMSPWDGFGDAFNAGLNWVGDTASDALGAVADWAIPRFMAMKRSTGEFLYRNIRWVATGVAILGGIACGVVSAGVLAVACGAGISGLAFGGASAAENCLGEDISGVDCAKTAAWDGTKAAAMDVVTAGVFHVAGRVLGDALPSIGRSASRALGSEGDDVWRAARRGVDDPFASTAARNADRLSMGHSGDLTKSFTRRAGSFTDDEVRAAVNNADNATTAARACSFTATTGILLADGTTKDIADIEVGDEVLAADPETGETVARRVTHVFVHEDTVFDLVVDDEATVTTTEDHPFWNTTDAEFQAAADLDAGDQILRADGDTLTVEGIDWTTARTATAYNLAIDDIHTYYVEIGDQEALVHNTCPLPRPSASGLGDDVAPRPLLNSAGHSYPDAIDPRTGSVIAQPPTGLTRVPVSERVAWGSQERGAFIKQWYDEGYKTPAGGWTEYDVHHIVPREYGGTNAFDNLVPVPRKVHQQEFNAWWRDY
jgi:RHS repeat-associated protein